MTDDTRNLIAAILLGLVLLGLMTLLAVMLTGTEPISTMESHYIEYRLGEAIPDMPPAEEL